MSLNQILGRVGRVNRIQRQRCRTIPTDRLRSATLCGRRMRHHSSPSCLAAGAPGRCDYLNGRSGDRPESSKNRRPERLRFLCANACRLQQPPAMEPRLAATSLRRLRMDHSRGSLARDPMAQGSQARGSLARRLLERVQDSQARAPTGQPRARTREQWPSTGVRPHANGSRPPPRSRARGDRNGP